MTTTEQETRIQKAKENYSQNKDTIVSANSLEVKSQDDVDTATEGIKILKVLKKEIDSSLGEIKKSSYNTYKIANEKYKQYSEPLDEAIESLKTKCLDYVTEQERIAEEKEKARQAEAKRLEDERLKKIKDAEEKAKKDKDERLAKIKEVEEAGNEEEAQRLKKENEEAEAKALKEKEEAEAEIPPPAYIPDNTPAVTTTKGSHFKTKKVPHITDKLELIKAIIDEDSHYSLDLIKIDEVALKKLVGGGITPLGVTVKEEKNMSVSAK